MNEQNISIEYRGVTIAYDEYSNSWKFLLRGREKSSGSLRTAKETIAKPAPKDKKPFSPVEAWYIQWRDDPDSVSVTSLAENRCGSQPEVWIKDSSGQRSKKGMNLLFATDEHNGEIVKRLLGITKEQAALNEEYDKLRRTLNPLKIDTTHEE